MTPDTITIGGREFRVGAWYEGKRPKDAARQVKPMRRQFMGWIGFDGMPHLIEFRTTTGIETNVLAASWLRWAGDEVAP